MDSKRLTLNLWTSLLLLEALFMFSPGVSARTPDPDTLRVLFVGNSFMNVNDLPTLFRSLCQGAGDDALVASRIPGGASVGDTIQGTFAHMYSPEVYALIRGADWDYLFLQDRQSRFAMGYGIFPGDSRVIEGHLKIRDSLLFYHPCAHMAWFAGFGPKDGYPPLAYSGEALIDSIYRNYLFLLDTAGQLIVPIGPAFLRIMKDHPEINLWGPDNEHPSLAGSSLIADLLYASIFKRRPLASSFNPGIPAQDDSVLKVTANNTVADSLERTGLQQITPDIEQNGNILRVNGYTDCSWFLDNLPILSAGCNCTIGQAGWYRAWVRDGNGCCFRTSEGFFTPSLNADGTSTPGPGIMVFPNPAVDFITVRSGVALLAVEVYDSRGCLLYAVKRPANPCSISTVDWPAGLCLVRLIPEPGPTTGIRLVMQH